MTSAVQTAAATAGPAPAEPRLTSLSHGGGCGCKIAPGLLSEILRTTARSPIPTELLVGIETADDAAVYRLVFDTESYFRAAGISGFYPEVSISFRLTEPERHHHVPLLLSPIAYSTYRGS